MMTFRRTFCLLITLLAVSFYWTALKPATVWAAPILRIAYIQPPNLIIQETGAAALQPINVIMRGTTELIGWSPDGKWLALKITPPGEKSAYLWVVDKNGQNLQQLTAEPLHQVVGWAPQQPVLAYTNQIGDQWSSPANNLMLAELVNGLWKSRELLAKGDEQHSGIGWFPDGRSLALTINSTLTSPIRIDRIYLDGRRHPLLSLKGEDLGEMRDDAIFRSQLNTLKISPNGRYLAAFLGSNSPSYNSAGMPICIIDLKSQKRITVGKGLGYTGWLAWSGDSKRLAFINGLGRSATTNKRLYIATTGSKKVIKVGKKGLVDTRPWWIKSTVYFSRGKETETWNTEDKRIPGQQIMAWRGGRLLPVTTPDANWTDLPVSWSPDGKYLLFLRLSSATRGDLLLMDLTRRTTDTILANFRGNPGYYGNFYPDWAAVTWLNASGS